MEEIEGGMDAWEYMSAGKKIERIKSVDTFLINLSIIIR